MPSVSGQTLLVIGGSSGIGFAAAKLALAEGVRVAIASSNADKVANAVERLKKSSDSANAQAVTGFTVDLSGRDVEQQLESLLTDVKASFGDELLDHLIFTAGDPISHRQTSDIDLDFIQQAGMVRFVAPLLIGKLAPRFFKSHWTSSITFTSGRLSERPLPQYTVMAAYAAGGGGLTRNLALDLAPIRVNQVNPGSVLTELWGAGAAARAEAVGKNTLLGKVGMPEDTAEAYIYLMKDRTANGAIVHNNGGELLR